MKSVKMARGPLGTAADSGGKYSISVVIPVYNNAGLLGEALDSVFAQTYPATEVIVVDDGSSEDIRAVTSRYGERVKYIRQENQGSAVARNTGIAAATGEWIAFLDSDDLWLPEKLEKQVAALRANPGASVCYTGHEVVDVDDPAGRFERYTPMPTRKVAKREMLRGCAVHTSGVMARRCALLDVGCFDTELRQAQDWELFARLAFACDFVGVPETLECYRLHGANTIRNEADRLRYGLAAVDKIFARPEARRYWRLRAGNRSRLYLQAGSSEYYFGDRERARGLLSRSVMSAVWNGEAWVLLVKARVPGRLVDFYRAVKGRCRLANRQPGQEV